MIIHIGKEIRALWRYFKIFLDRYSRINFINFSLLFSMFEIINLKSFNVARLSLQISVIFQKKIIVNITGFLVQFKIYKKFS